MRTALLVLLMLAGCRAEVPAWQPVQSALSGGSLHHGALRTGATYRGGLAPPPGGCPAFPSTPDLHYAARLETAYANNDPVPTMTDQGSKGNNATQGVGSAQPTFKLPCESGKLGGLACYDGDAGDYTASSTFTAETQPTFVCAVYRFDVDNITQYAWSGLSGTNRSDFRALSGSLQMITSAALTVGTTAAGSYETICATYNSTSSSGIINGGTPTTGDAGSHSTIGFGLMAYAPSPTAYMDGAVVEWAYWNTPVDAAAVKDVFDCYYGTSWPQALSSEGVTTTDVSVPSAVKQYALRLHKRGLSPRQIGERVRDRLIARGVDPAEAEQLGRRMARAARGRVDRDVDTLHTVRVSLVSRFSDRAAMGNRIGRALCKPLADEDGSANADALACFQSERQWLTSEQWCEVGTTTPVLAAGRSWMTADEADRVQVEVAANPELRGIRNATDERHSGLMQAAAAAIGLGAVERCTEGA